MARDEADGYDPSVWLTLGGTEGLAEGQLVRVRLGQTVSVGRSRHCDWSLRRSPAYLVAEGGARKDLEADVGFTSCSRRHFEVAYLAPDLVEVRNLSSNGTFVDGHRVDRLLLTDCRQRSHRLRLGPCGVQLDLSPGSLPV
jgi:hypothetical protein